MCGIVGYIGHKNALPMLLDGLKRLEYRGYDSSGVAILRNGKILLQKKVGKVTELEKNAPLKQYEGMVGIGHTRWATHGEPSDVNSHPHMSADGTIAMIHNGIIENYQVIKTKLMKLGYTFVSATDTEALVHLIQEMKKVSGDIETAVRLALRQVEGTYGIAVVSSQEPDKIIVARKGSPLIIGVGENEHFVASDAAAIIPYTRQVVYLEDGEIAVLTDKGFETKTIDNVEKIKQIHEVTFDIEEIEKGGYDHFMLKEIMEQPETVRNSMRGRVLPEEGNAKLSGLNDVMLLLENAQRIIITACGTSWHAGLVGEYMLEQYAKVPVEVEYASEFRYRNPIIKPNDLLFLVSQSGETADTLAALREAKKKGASVLGVCNVVGSTIARESQGGVYIHAGPEIGVASTKAFTSQLVVLSLITLLIARQRKTISDETAKLMCREMLDLPNKIQSILTETSHIESIAEEFRNAHNFLYLGRGLNFPVALEGALKLKEISYIHAEGYPAAEMKHGPIALIDENMPVVVIAPKDGTYDKILSNIQEVKARKGKVIAIANELEPQLSSLADHIILVPQTIDLLSPIVNVIPLQLLAYFIAVKRGCNVDQPRNLAKSVTVE
uniref:Glutamine--fructose-6-phosphate aminotransferase [isomerizing] n=1 Tax=uncultured bacterium pAM1 TaxID=1781153 RepID=A0A1C9U4U5_9BACT|nr:glutamine amidotransferase [uncultured bacterium pAM1]